jgi:hypothetical protein
MALQTVSSCDFVTKLPVCPSNGPPMYRDFTAEDLPQIEAIMATPTWATLRKGSDWQRAYALADHLGETGANAALQVDRATAQDRGYILAIDAYAYYLTGQKSQRDARLDLIGATPDDTFLASYVAAIKSCSVNMETVACQPNAPFNP